MFRNEANQKIGVFAYDATTGVGVTGDAANITAYISIDGSAAATNDTNPTEVDATNMPGLYEFDMTQAETNGGAIALIAKSTTSNIVIQPVFIYPVVRVVTTAGSALQNTVAESFTLTTGAQVNTYTSTHQLDGTYHQLSDSAGTLDAYYEITLQGNEVPSQVTLFGRLFSSNDTLTVQQYDWDGASWNTRGSIVGVNTAIDQAYTIQLLSSLVGTGANLGKVRIRLYGTGLTTSTLYLDELVLGYTATSQSVGYALGAIWVDTGGSNTNTVPFVDGVADNQVSTWAAALTLAASTSLYKFAIANASSITLTGASNNYTLVGDNWTLNLNNQNISSMHVSGAHINGVATGSNHDFHDCQLASTSLSIEDGDYFNCALAGPITLTAAGTYYFDKCFSGIAGAATPSIDLGAGGAAINLNLRHYSGGIELKNVGASDAVSLEGQGQLVINANCTGGTIQVRGNFKITDNSGGAVTIDQTANYTNSNVNAEVLDVLTVDTQAEPASAPTWPATMVDMIKFIFALAKNKTIQNVSGAWSLRDTADTINIATGTNSDDGTEAIKGTIS